MKIYTFNNRTKKMYNTEKKCITKKINLYKPQKVFYSRCQTSILIDNNEDIEKYLNCYKIPNIVKLLCKSWIKKHGCFLDNTCFYAGTIYLTLTKKHSFYNHIHLFPGSNYFTWHDKKSKKNGKYSSENSVNKYINLFEKMLK